MHRHVLVPGSSPRDRERQVLFSRGIRVRARLLMLLVPVLALVASPLLATDHKAGFTEAKLLAERGLHLDAARMFGAIARDASLAPEERARARIHEGAALEAALEFDGAAEAFVDVLRIARSEEIVELLVQAVTHVIPPPGRLRDEWRSIAVEKAPRGKKSRAVVRWPQDRLPRFETGGDVVMYLGVRDGVSLGDALRPFAGGRRWPFPDVKPAFDGCERDERIVRSIPQPIEWVEGLRTLVNLYELEATLDSGLLTIRCGAGGEQHEPPPGVDLGVVVGTQPHGETDPCTDLRETITLPGVDAAGLAAIAAMVDRHVPTPSLVQLCGTADTIETITELVGAMEHDQERYKTLDLKEVWAVKEGYRFTMHLGVAGRD